MYLSESKRARRLVDHLWVHSDTEEQARVHAYRVTKGNTVITNIEQGEMPTIPPIVEVETRPTIRVNPDPLPVP
jgi:hypothetical protein